MTELRYFTGLCDRKENGQYCYELFSNAAEFALHTQLPCYVTAELNGTCICRSELTSMAKEFGCSANYFELVYQNITGDPNYTPGDLYAKCNVDIPGECSEKGNFALFLHISVWPRKK